MGNFCPMCEPENREMPWETKGECAWCKGVIDTLNQTERKKLHQSHDFSPLHLFGTETTFICAVEEVVCRGPFAVLGRDQKSDKVEDLSGFFHGTPQQSSTPLNRFDFAVYKEWNSAEKRIVLFVPKGIVYFKGTVGPQTPLYHGGGEQYYIPPNVAKLLREASEKFRKSEVPHGLLFTNAAYKKFLRDCEPAFAEQRTWQATYAKQKQHHDRVSTEHNLLHQFQERVKYFQEQVTPHEIQKLHAFQASLLAASISLPEHKEQYNVLKLSTQSLVAQAEKEALQRDFVELQQSPLASKSYHSEGFLEFAHKVLEFRSRGNKEMREWTFRVQEAFEKATGKDLRRAVAEYIVARPQKGNVFEKNVPSDIRSFLCGNQTNLALPSKEEPEKAPRTFTVHVSKGYKGKPALGVQMVVTYSHSTTEQRGQTTITTHFYIISYSIQ